MTLTEYEELIPPAHRYPREDGAVRSKFAEFVLLCVRQGKELSDALDSFVDEFDLEGAAGKQLDFVGAIVGADRKLPFPVTESDGWLSDDDYRLLIKARISTNGWDGTNESLYNIFESVFAGYGVSFEDAGVAAGASRQSMHINFKIRGAFTDIQKYMLNGDLILPRPAGVDTRVDIISTLSRTEINTDTVMASDFMSTKLKDAAEYEE